MGFQPVVLWTDLLLFGLIACVLLAAWSARRSEPAPSTTSTSPVI